METEKTVKAEETVKAAETVETVKAVEAVKAAEPKFYIVISSIKKYDIALKALKRTLPPDVINIVVYQNEPEETYKTLADGNIEVTIKNNLYDYGSWIGIQVLIDNKIVNKDAWFLLIHDTCKMRPNSISLITKIISTYSSSENDIIWLSARGQCNLSLIRRAGITCGFNQYKNMLVMDKMESVYAEWNESVNSPKRFPVKQVYLDKCTVDLGIGDVYKTGVYRTKLLFPTVNIEKYFVFISKSSEHPARP